MIKQLLKISGLTLWLILLSYSSKAQELKIITENAPPNSFVKKGKLTGSSVEVVQAVLREIGMEGHRIDIYPWARGYMMLKSRKNIVLFPTSRTRYRERLFKWAGPISDNRVNIYKLKKRTDIKVVKLEDIKKYSIGSGRFDQKSQYLKSKGYEPEIVSEDIQNINKLFAGRIDLIAYAERRLSYDMRRSRHDMEKIELVINLKDISTHLYLAFSNSTDDSVVKRFQLGFDNIRKKKIHEQILKRWK